MNRWKHLLGVLIAPEPETASEVEHLRRLREDILASPRRRTGPELAADIERLLDRLKHQAREVLMTALEDPTDSGPDAIAALAFLVDDAFDHRRALRELVPAIEREASDEEARRRLTLRDIQDCLAALGAR